MSVPEKCDTCGKLSFPGETVTISADEYRELLAFRAAREVPYAQYPGRLKSRSRAARDPEVATFILQSAQTMILEDIVNACRERFGPERSPSRSSIHRFLQFANGGR